MSDDMNIDNKKVDSCNIAGQNRSDNITVICSANSSVHKETSIGSGEKRVFLDGLVFEKFDEPRYLSIDEAMAEADNRMCLLENPYFDENEETILPEDDPDYSKRLQFALEKRDVFKTRIRDALSRVNVASYIQDEGPRIIKRFFVLNVEGPPPVTNAQRNDLIPVIREILSEDAEFSDNVLQRIYDQLDAESSIFGLPDQTSSIIPIDSEDEKSQIREHDAFGNMSENSAEYNAGNLNDSFNQKSSGTATILSDHQASNQSSFSAGFEPRSLVRYRAVKRWDRTYFTNPDNFAGFVGYVLPSQKSGNCGNVKLGHPPWYLGFWRDTEIRLWGIRNDMSNPETIDFEFGDPTNPWPRPIIRYFLMRDRGQGDDGEHVIPIAEYYNEETNEDDISYHAEEDRLTRLRRSKKDNEDKKDSDGWMVVYNYREWKCNLTHKPYDGAYSIDTNAFDRIVMSTHSETGYMLERIQITLNDEVILEKDYSANPILINRNRHYNLEYDIKSSRIKTLLFNGWMRNPASCPNSYNWQDIYHNELLQFAARDIGQCWSPKYGAPFDKLWCSEFQGWNIRKNKDFDNFPDGQLACDDLKDWFVWYNRWIDPSNCDWRHLNSRIKPGFYCSMKFGNHSVMFIYWTYIGVTYSFPSDGEADTVREHLIEAIDETERLGERPGAFNPNSYINTFYCINGCQSNCVRTRVGAIVKLPPNVVSTDCTFIKDIIGIDKEKKSPVYTVIWLEGLDPNDANLIDGFGDTR